jgi:hypothetical protein
MNKITLITPPDLYENYNKSVLFINLNETDQESASKWLSNIDLKENYNFYIYSGEPDIPWLLHSSSASQFKFIDIDGLGEIPKQLTGYLLGKNNVYYKTADENLAAIYGHINTNRVSTIEKFLEKVFSE